MTARPTHRRWASPLVATALLLGALGAPPAQADEAADAPVTRDDQVTLAGGSFGPVDVLANDTDPNGDELAVCRVEVPDDVPLFVDTQEHALFVGVADERARGTYEITYYACDHDYLTPATLTVTVKRPLQIKVRKVEDRPGVLRFINPGARRVTVLYGDKQEERPDGRFRLDGHDAASVRVTRHNIFYVAFTRADVIAGFGEVRGIKLGTRAHDRAVPPAVTDRDLRQWRSAPR